MFLIGFLIGTDSLDSKQPAFNRDSEQYPGAVLLFIGRIPTVVLAGELS